MKILNKAVAKVAQKVGVSFVTGKIRDAAEGRLGEGPKTAYWALVGQKRIISLLAGACAAVCAYGGFMEGATIFGVLAGIGLAVGVLDADWRAEKPVWLESTAWWRFLADNSATITALSGMAAAALNSCNQDTADMLMKAHLTCAQGTWVLGAGSVVAGFLGLKDSAMKSTPPVPTS